MAGNAIAGIDKTIKVQGAADYHQGNNQQPINYRRGQEEAQKPVQTNQDKTNDKTNHREINYGASYFLRASFTAMG